jgi:ribonuclease D
MTQYAPTIEKAQISQMPTAVYSGTIRVISSTAEALTALSYLSRQRCVGVDTETRPTFRKGALNKVALLQVATRQECFLFRLNLISDTEVFKSFFENVQVEKVGLSLKDDIAALRRRLDFSPAGWIDLQNMVGERGIDDRSLQKIYANLFGERISKRQQLSNWEAEHLTDAQQAYASLDAYSCLRIYEQLTQ